MINQKVVMMFNAETVDFMEKAKKYVESKVDFFYDSLHHESGYLRKEVLSSFTLSEQEGMIMEESGTGDYLKNMVENVYDHTYKTDLEVKERSDQLRYVISHFWKYNDTYHIGTFKNSIIIVNTKFGLFFKFKKPTNRSGVISTDEGLSLYTSGLGSTPLIDREGVSIEGVQILGEVLTSGYHRVKLGGFYFRSHTLLIALKYGFEVSKHLLGRFSFLTVDHKNGVTCDNSFSNLRVVTRRDNTLTASTRFVPYDFLNLYSEEG